MESTFFDFNDFGDFDLKTSKENLKENRKSSILFIISLFLIIILGILSILKGNELSNISREYSELIIETFNLQNTSNELLKENIEQRTILVNIFNLRKEYEAQYEKDNKQKGELENDNEKLEKKISKFN